MKYQLVTEKGYSNVKQTYNKHKQNTRLEQPHRATTRCATPVEPLNQWESYCLDKHATQQPVISIRHRFLLQGQHFWINLTTEMLHVALAFENETHVVYFMSTTVSMQISNCNWVKLI